MLNEKDELLCPKQDFGDCSVMCFIPAHPVQYLISLRLGQKAWRLSLFLCEPSF